MKNDGHDKFWYNMATTEVEFGFVSNSFDRVGPFNTREEAEAAPQKIRENSEKWEKEERDNQQ